MGEGKKVGVMVGEGKAPPPKSPEVPSRGAPKPIKSSRRESKWGRESRLIEKSTKVC